MNRKKIVIWLVIITLTVGGFVGYREFQTAVYAYKWLQNHAKSDAESWVSQQSLMIYLFDRALANALAASSVERRQEYIDDAIKSVYRSTTDDLPPNVAYFLRGVAASIHLGSVEYLKYVRDEKGPLKEAQLEALQSMRKRALAIYPKLNQLSKLIRETDASRLQENDEIEQLINELAQEVNQIPVTWRNDKQFNDYLYAKNPYPVRRFVFEGESLWNGAQLAKRAKEFMGDLWSGPLHNRIQIYGGGNNNRLFGQFKEFGAFDENGLSSSYMVEITVTGGHILKAYFALRHGKDKDEPLGKMDQEEALKFAEGLIERWQEEPLSLKEIEDKKTSLRFVFHPMRDNKPVLQQSVEILIDHKKGRLLEFDASNYFKYYKQVVPVEPVLSPEEAIAKLNDYLKAAGEPQLRAKEEKLVYAIPVEGIDLVTHVLINAVNGREEGILYGDDDF